MGRPFGIACAYAFCLRALIFCLIVLPAWYVMRLSPRAVGYLSSALWCPYVGIAAAQFYSGSKIVSWLKGTAAAGLTLILTNLILDGLSALYSSSTHA